MEGQSSAQHPEWRAEQAYVDRVVAAMRAKLAELEGVLRGVRGEIVEFRRHFWDDVTINLNTLDDLVETHFAIRQQAEVLGERERRYQQAAKTKRTLERQVSSPFFARIDFRYEGEREAEPIYIGIASFRDERDQTFLVHDWRAPISSVYYDALPGPASFKAPAGIVRGELTLKRQFVIRGGAILAMFDAGLTIGDELLMYALSRRSDAQMHNIVATIQRQQNVVIRDDESPALLVTGAAGSGKTSAALQRAAYLLYKHRGDLDARQMLFFSPNPLFMSYISNVLPELGEDNIEQATFYDYLCARLQGEFVVEDPFDQMERLLEAGEDSRMARAVRYKASKAFADEIDRYVAGLAPHMRFHPILVEGRVIATATDVKAAFDRTDPGLRLPLRVDLVKEELLNRLRQFERDEALSDWVQKAVDGLPDEAYRRAERTAAKRKRECPDLDEQEEARRLLGREVLRRMLRPVRRFVETLRFVDTAGLYRAWFEQAESHPPEGFHPEDWAQICRQTVREMDEGTLWYEDATPYLYMKEQILGRAVSTPIRHVLVDEVQDYSVLQLRLIRSLFPYSRITMLGDPQQLVSPHRPGILEEDEMARLFPGLVRVAFGQSYRSTRQIVLFTRGMVPKGVEIQPFDRDGALPRLAEVSGEAQQAGVIARWLGEFADVGYQTTAVLTKTQAEAERLAKELERLGVKLRRLDKRAVSLEPGVVVAPVYLAKGVEFDGVIVANASREQYKTAFDRQLLYTACTRAMHELRMVSVGEASPWILSQPEDTYERVDAAEVNAT